MEEKGLSITSVTDEIKSLKTVYTYLLISTTLVFVLIGFELGRVADRLRASANNDPLTGLANRRVFNRHLSNEVERGKRYESKFSLLLIDLDGLKIINDQKGHLLGDRAIFRVANALQYGCRNTDLAARVGGDEFAIIATETTVKDTLGISQRIHKFLHQRAKTGHLRVSVSIGIAEYGPTTATSVSQLYNAADSALYRAKEAGRNCTIVSRYEDYQENISSEPQKEYFDDFPEEECQKELESLPSNLNRSKRRMGPNAKVRFIDWIS